MRAAQAVDPARDAQYSHRRRHRCNRGGIRWAGGRRDGTRQNAIMQPMAKGLTDTNIANIAAYVSTLKP
jgi:hypothetical protein